MKDHHLKKIKNNNNNSKCQIQRITVLVKIPLSIGTVLRTGNWIGIQLLEN